MTSEFRVCQTEQFFVSPRRTHVADRPAGSAKRAVWSCAREDSHSYPSTRAPRGRHRSSRNFSGSSRETIRISHLIVIHMCTVRYENARETMRLILNKIPFYNYIYIRMEFNRVYDIGTCRKYFHGIQILIRMRFIQKPPVRKFQCGKINFVDFLRKYSKRNVFNIKYRLMYFFPPSN